MTDSTNPETASTPNQILDGSETLDAAALGYNTDINAITLSATFEVKLERATGQATFVGEPDTEPTA